MRANRGSRPVDSGRVNVAGALTTAAEFGDDWNTVEAAIHAAAAGATGRLYTQLREALPALRRLGVAATGSHVAIRTRDGRAGIVVPLDEARRMRRWESESSSERDA